MAWKCSPVIAICLLGRIGDREDIDLLSPIVFDDGEFERELYHTLEPLYLFCSLQNCNYVLYQHFTHAVMSVCKLADKHGVDIKEKLKSRLSGESRERIISAITWEESTGAFYGETVDFIDHVLANC